MNDTYAAHSQIATDKAARYLKALCNHFSHKVTAEYNDDRGTVQFGFGFCEMEAVGGALVLHVRADDAENFARVKHVVADHLERFSGDDKLQVQWIDQA